MILYYDGSVSGFFCLLGKIFKEKIPYSDIRKKSDVQTADLFETTMEVITDDQWADKVTRGIEKRLGRKFLNTLVLALLSESQGIETLLVNIAGQSFKHGGSYIKNPLNSGVFELDRAALQTSRERHRLLGLIRFVRLVDDSYLALIEPRTNVLPLLGGHFSRRFNGRQKWIVSDINRKTAVWHDGKQWSLEKDVEISTDVVHHATETSVSDLWKIFYRNISNPQRYNPKLRRQFIPKRYWQQITELQKDPPVTY